MEKKRWFDYDDFIRKNLLTLKPLSQRLHTLKSIRRCRKIEAKLERSLSVNAESKEEEEMHEQASSSTCFLKGASNWN